MKKAPLERSVAKRAAAWLVRLFPPSFREEYGRDVAETLEARSREVDGRGPGHRLRFWLRESLALLAAAARMHREELRKGTRMLSHLPQDLSRTIRSLARRPGFSLVVLATLALGIGANTAIFSLLDQVVLRPLPYPDSDELMMVYFHDLENPENLTAATPADYHDWRDVGGYESMAAYYWEESDLHAQAGEPESIKVIAALGDLLGVLGVSPAAGRAWGPGEGAQVAIPSTAGAPEETPAVVVISDGLSRRLFGTPQAAVGRDVSLSGKPYSVIGVMPASFHFPSPDVQAWMPVRLTPESLANRTEYLLRVVARLSGGRGARERLESEMEALGARLREQHPKSNSDLGIRVIPMRERLVSGVSDSLWTLWMAVGLVLLVACVNVANLMLVRNMGRRREMALRKALGAGRFQVARQSLLESLSLALLGGGLGALLAWASTDAVKALAPAGLPRLEQVAVDARVLLFSLGLSMGAGILFGLVPALRMSRLDPGQALQEGARGASRSRSASRFQKGLVVAEVALSVVLLAGAGLTIRSFFSLAGQDPGYDPGRLLATSVSAPEYRYPDEGDVRGFFQRMMSEARALPGVESASFTSALPLSGGGNSAWIHIKEHPLPEGRTPDFVMYRIVGRDLFRTLGVPIRRGRPFQAKDHGSSMLASIVNEAFARRYFGQGEDALGKHISLGPEGYLPWARIVGVAADMKNGGLHRPPSPAVFLLHEQMPAYWRSAELVVRAAPGAENSVAPQLRAALRRLDPRIPVFDIREVESDIASTLNLRRLVIRLLAGFAAAALLLSALGLFGVLSYAVSTRVPEIGVRLALGARPGAIRALVVRTALLPTALGLAIGLAASLNLDALLAGHLYQVAETDPLTWALVVLTLLAASLAAAAFPALRASRIDPTRALRAQGGR